MVKKRMMTAWGGGNHPPTTFEQLEVYFLDFAH